MPTKDYSRDLFIIRDLMLQFNEHKSSQETQVDEQISYTRICKELLAVVDS